MKKLDKIEKKQNGFGKQGAPNAFPREKSGGEQTEKKKPLIPDTEKPLKPGREILKIKCTFIPPIEDILFLLREVKPYSQHYEQTIFRRFI